MLAYYLYERSRGRSPLVGCCTVHQMDDIELGFDFIRWLTSSEIESWQRYGDGWFREKSKSKANWHKEGF